MNRKISKIIPQIYNLNLENLGQRILVTGDIKEEIEFIDENKKVKSIKDCFSFNHSFPAPNLKEGFPVKGEVSVEHITSTIVKNGKNLAKDYLLLAKIKGEGLIRPVEEKFFIQHSTELPPHPVSEVKLGKRQFTFNPVEKKEIWSEDLEQKIEAFVSILLNEKLQEWKEEQKEKRTSPLPCSRAQIDKDRIIKKSKKQQISGYTTKK